MKKSMKKSLRRMLSSLLALTMITSMVTTVAFAAPEATAPTLVVEVTSASGQENDTLGIDDVHYAVEAGDELTVTVYIDETASQYANAMWTLTYDTEYLTYEGLGSTTTGNVVVGTTSITDYTYGTTGTAEYVDGRTALATYSFSVNTLTADTEDTEAYFYIASTYVNTYGQSIAGSMVEANAQGDYVTIGMKDMTVTIPDPTDDDDDDGTTPEIPEDTDPTEPTFETETDALGITTYTLTVPYNGESYESYITAVASGDGAVVSNNGWTGGEDGDRACTDVGTYTTTYTATLDGYNSVTCKAVIVIVPRTTTTTIGTIADDETTDTLLDKQVPVTVSGFVDEYFTGTVKVTIDGVTGIDPVTTEYAITDTELTQNADKTLSATFIMTVADGGKYDITAEYVPGTNDNYTASNDSEEDVLFIGKETLQEMDDVEVVYDGDNHTVTPTEIEGWTATVTYTDNEGDGEDGRTNVGTETVTITYTHDDGLYEDYTYDIELTVSKREVTVTVDDQTIEYGADYPTTFSYTVDEGSNAIVEGQTLDLIYEIANTDGLIGDKDITATADDTTVNSNYEITINTGTLTIEATNYDKDPGETEQGESTTEPDDDDGSVYIEVVNNYFRDNTNSPDYVKSATDGYRMIIVYTDKAGLYASYDGMDMFDISGNEAYAYVDDAGAEFAFTAGFDYKYAIVVPAEYISGTQLTAAQYRAKVEITNDSTDIGGVVTYGTNVNDSADGTTDLNDLSTVYGVYNANTSYMTQANALVILGADVNKDKIVNVSDATIVKADWVDSLS